ncbi:hypothetical protein Hanom_Chr07g00603961 [Helianthus anomalus]
MTELENISQAASVSCQNPHSASVFTPEHKYHKPTASRSEGLCWYGFTSEVTFKGRGSPLLKLNKDIQIVSSVQYSFSAASGTHDGHIAAYPLRLTKSWFKICCYIKKYRRF